MKLEDPQLERLLADYRVERRPTGADKRRLWQQLDAERRRRRWPRVALVAAVALAAMVLLWIGLGPGSGDVQQLDPGATGHQAPFERSASPGGRAVPRASRSATTEPAPVAPVEVVDSSSSPSVEPPDLSPTTPAPVRTPAAGRVEPPPAEPVPPRMGELELIEAAESALRSGQLEQALARLREHAERFGTSDTEEERRALRVLVLCRLGRVTEGRGARWAFLRDFPRSTYRPRITAACPRP